MTETDPFSSKTAEIPKAQPHLEKPSFDSATLSAAERSKLSSASYLKIPSEPEPLIEKEVKKPEIAEVPEQKTEEIDKAEQERQRLEEELEKAKERAEAESRRELTAAQVQAKCTKTEKEMFEELEMLTATKNLTPAQIGSVLQWLIKQEIIQSERIKNLQKEIALLSEKK